MKKSFIGLLFSNFLLILGVLSLLMMVNQTYDYGGFLLLLGAVFAHFEPRLKNTFHRLEEREDPSNSAAHLLVFAINPVLLIYLLFNFKTMGFLSVVPCLLFPMGGLHQLNHINETKKTSWVPLLPLSHAGAALTFFAVILQFSPTLRFLPYLLMLIFSYLMIRPKLT